MKFLLMILMTLLLLSCSKKTMKDLTQIDSSISPFYDNVTGDYLLVPEVKGTNSYFRISENGRFAISFTGSSPCKCFVGNWALDDSTLIFISDSSKEFSQYDFDDTLETDWEIDVTQFTLKISSISDSIYFDMNDDENETNFFERLDQDNDAFKSCSGW